MDPLPGSDLGVFDQENVEFSYNPRRPRLELFYILYIKIKLYIIIIYIYYIYNYVSNSIFSKCNYIYFIFLESIEYI